jgi:hypothetical protein
MQEVTSLDGSVKAYMPPGAMLLSGTKIVTPAEADIIRNERRNVSKKIDDALNALKSHILTLVREVSMSYTPCDINKVSSLVVDSFDALEDPSSCLFLLTKFDIMNVTTTFKTKEGKIGVSWKYDLMQNYTELATENPSRMDECLAILIEKIVHAIAYSLNVPDSKTHIMVAMPPASLPTTVPKTKTNKRQKKN